MMENAITKTLLSAILWDKDDYWSIAINAKRRLIETHLRVLLENSEDLTSLFSDFLSSSSEAEQLLFLDSPMVWNALITLLEQQESISRTCQLVKNEVQILQSFSESIGEELPARDFSQKFAESAIWASAGDRALVQMGNQAYRMTNMMAQAGPVVDGFSNFARARKIKDVPGRHEPLGYQDMSFVTGLVDEAFDRIQGMNPGLYRLLQTVVKVVLPRNDPDNKGFGSCSTNLYNGMIVITNAHRKSTTVELVMEALVHEATHAMFDCAEIYEPCVPSKFSDLRVVSPWTGTELDPNTYVQACYTWLGLLKFWDDYTQHDPSNSAASEQRERASFGFDTNCMVSNATKIEGLYSPEIISVLREIELTAHSL